MKPEDYNRWLKLLDIPQQVETDRLLLRLLDDKDAPELFASIETSRDFLSKHTNWAAMKFMTEADTLAEIHRFRALFFKREDLHYFAFEKTTGKMVGSIGQHCTMERTPTWEIGYSLFEPFTGKGYATEGARAMVQMAFELLEANRLVLVMDSENTPSRKIAEQLGFAYELTMKEQEWNYDHTRLFDLAFYSLIKPEYEDREKEFQVLL